MKLSFHSYRLTDLGSLAILEVLKSKSEKTLMK